jgi:uncharacterized protein
MKNELKISIDYNQDVHDYLRTNYPEIYDYRILSKSLDARRASSGRTPQYHLHIEWIGKNESFENTKESFPNLGEIKDSPLIVGTGPAGLFCALRFAEYGIKCSILERGHSVQRRMRKIARFWRYGELDQNDNVCFGEGGAGLFSDGKLLTRVKDPFVSYVMNKFVEFGAPQETAYLSNPYLGSNKIRNIIERITSHLKSVGSEIIYGANVENIILNPEKDSVIGVQLNNGKQFFSQNIILATGHSAQNIYYNLYNNDVKMCQKDFAVGVRVEHLREEINKMQYGAFAQDELLGAARYRLSYHNKTSGRGVYSFCMCPGGYVLSSGSEKEGIVTNGMSNNRHNSPWSNSAIIVTVNSNDFDSSDVLAGLKFQRSIENRAYNLSKELSSGREIPALSLKEFLNNRIGNKFLPSSSVPSGVVKGDISELFPQYIVEELKNGFEYFGKRLRGFCSKDALLIAPETRTSAPLFILRDRETLESISHKGLYPCGEGAGYAGGITSAAIDGINVAMRIIAKTKNYKIDQ